MLLAIAQRSWFGSDRVRQAAPRFLNSWQAVSYTHLERRAAGAGLTDRAQQAVLRVVAAVRNNVERGIELHVDSSIHMGILLSLIHI